MVYDMYTYLQVPPRTRITPDIDLSSHKRPHVQQQEQPPTQPFAHTRREPHMHMRAMMKKVGLREGDKHPEPEMVLFTHVISFCC